MNKINKRFFIKVEKTNSCWNWKAYINKYTGYGRFYNGKKTVEAHRFSYEIHKGKVPKGLEIDHLCRNRICVNPNHLEAVTRKENVFRGNGFCGINARKTHCPYGHEYSKDNVRKWDIANKSYRSCRTCHNIAQMHYRRKIKNETN